MLPVLAEQFEQFEELLMFFQDKCVLLNVCANNTAATNLKNFQYFSILHKVYH
jgi:hypothetical protein